MPSILDRFLHTAPPGLPGGTGIERFTPRELPGVRVQDFESLPAPGAFPGRGLAVGLAQPNALPVHRSNPYKPPEPPRPMPPVSLSPTLVPPKLRTRHVPKAGSAGLHLGWGHARHIGNLGRSLPSTGNPAVTGLHASVPPLSRVLPTGSPLRGKAVAKGLPLAGPLTLPTKAIAKGLR